MGSFFAAIFAREVVVASFVIIILWCIMSGQFVLAGLAAVMWVLVGSILAYWAAAHDDEPHTRDADDGVQSTPGVVAQSVVYLMAVMMQHENTPKSKQMAQAHTVHVPKFDVKDGVSFVLKAKVLKKKIAHQIFLHETEVKAREAQLDHIKMTGDEAKHAQCKQDLEKIGSAKRAWHLKMETLRRAFNSNIIIPGAVSPFDLIVVPRY